MTVCGGFVLRACPCQMFFRLSAAAYSEFMEDGPGEEKQTVIFVKMVVLGCVDVAGHKAAAKVSVRGTLQFVF